MKKVLTTLTLLGLTLLARAEEARYTIHAEGGFLAALKHDIQFGKNGTYFSYDRDGGQDTLFAVQRFSLDRKQGKHILTLLYQPLELQAQVKLRNDLLMDGAFFPAGSAIITRYSFPFYRAS
jgi:hypothetical protein